MSHFDEPKREELEDRLMDRALREVLGGESPPDLSAQILAAAEKQSQVSPQPKEKVMDKPQRTRRRWIIYAATACLVASVCAALIVPATQRARETARMSGVEETVTAPDTQRSGSEQREGEPASATTQPRPGEPVTPQSGEKQPSRELNELSEINALEMPADEPTVDTSGMPASSPMPSEEPPVAYPDAKAWEELTRSREKLDVAGPDARQTPRPESKEGRSDDLDSLRMLVEPRVVIEEKEAQPEPFLGYRWTPDSKADSKDKESAEYWGMSPSGVGPGKGGDKYDRLVENPFRLVKDHPLSTFSIDVDTASYANVRRFLLREGRLPPPDAVRIEELVNYFDYDYAGPEDDVPFASHIEVAACPWSEGHQLVRIGLKGREIENDERPESNLVFLLDVSGSMNSPDKLPLVKEGMKLLASQLRENDRVAIVVYASSEGLVLESTPGSDRQKILEALERLTAGGSTAGGAGIELAYRIAQQNLIEGGVNRVILCTDGDFNVGTTSTAALERMVEEKARSGVFLSVLGFGRGNLNDAMMETISNKGNGNYSYIDGTTEAHRVLVEQMGGTLVTIAKDVKIQVEFNPARVAAYRLIGYENRMLAAEDFNDDKKDAGEIGAGHTVTALYELVPSGKDVDVPSVDPLKYQPAARPDGESASNELLTLKLRYKEPDGDKSKLLEFPLVDADRRFGQASSDMQFAASVASFGMLLRGSQYAGTANYDAVLEIASSAKGPDPHGYRAEFLDIIRRAKALAGKE